MLDQAIVQRQFKRHEPFFLNKLTGANDFDWFYEAIYIFMLNSLRANVHVHLHRVHISIDRAHSHSGHHSHARLKHTHKQ